jgi:phosphate starvation-inducible protein PhoH and related proteins
MKDPGDPAVPLPADEASLIFGPGDASLRILCQRLGVNATYRDSLLRFNGPPEAVALADAVIARLRRELEISGQLSPHSLEAALGFPERHDSTLEITVPGRAGRIIPKTSGQESYLRAIRDSDIAFCIGPAGTGKTFLAVASAVAALSGGKVERIIISRPAVEAGEKLGFLPGDLQQKIDPYLRPVYDALDETLTPARVKRSLDNRIIEVAPLAYMRGRTLNNAFIILDEAQNTTLTQLKMFLTRLGSRSTAIITGDVTQIDLRPPESSGLILIRDILAGIEGVTFTDLDFRDVVRHPLVQRIISAFENAARKSAGMETG